MKKVINIISSSIIFLLTISLFSNLVISFYEKTFFSILSFRNLYLISLIFCLIYKSKFINLLLLILSIFFWYNYFFLNNINSFHSNSIIYFTVNIFEVIKSFVNNIFFKKIILTLPFFSFLLITILIIPVRLKHFFNGAKEEI